VARVSFTVVKSTRCVLVVTFVAVAVVFGCARASVDDKTIAQPLGAGWQAGLSPACTPFYSAAWTPVLAPTPARPSPSAKPPRGKPFADATLKTCVVRVTDHAADNVPGFARNDYSRRQAFNADDSRIVVAARDGTWSSYDPRSNKNLGRLEGIGGDAEPQWHPTNPKLLYYFPGFGLGMQIRELDVTTNKSRVVADLAARIKAVWPTATAAWTKSEGSPSRDARYWGLMVDDAQWKGLGMLTYDLTKDQIIATYDYAKNGRVRPDHVSMTPSGTWITASWDDGVYAFTRDFKTSTKLHHKGEHSDLAIAGNGDDLFVSIDYEKSGGPLFMTNVRTGARTDLFATYIDHSATAIHFSGRAFARPGWVLVSTYAASGPAQWLHGKVMAVELKEHPRVIELAANHVVYDEYFTEPHASVNRDFTRVVFDSNWDIKTQTDVDTYLIELPKALLP
jgi:hypothetical protein